MKRFVGDKRDEVKIVAITVVTGAVLLAGETISELVYLPLCACFAAVLVWQWLRRPRGPGPKALPGVARSKGSR